MDLTNVDWITPTRGSLHKDIDSWARLSYSKSGSKASMQLTITIYKDCIKHLRWLSGDRVEIGDAGEYFVVRRVAEGGYKLCETNIKKGIKKTGNSSTCTISLTRPDVRKEIDKHNISKSDVLIQDGMLILTKRKPVK